MPAAVPPLDPVPLPRPAATARSTATLAAYAARGLALGVALALAAGLIVLGGVQQCNHQRGEALFHGLAPIRSAAAATVSRCAGCHHTAANLGSLGERLPATGKPGRVRQATVYTEQSFCRTLRDGIEPSGALLAPAAPHQSVDAADCAAIWTYLSAR